MGLFGNWNSILRKLVTILILLLAASSCQKEEYTISNLNGNSIDVLGHGGMGISDLYPMNSLEGIANCLALQADGSEMDIQMTADSVLVLFHDSELSESTDISGVVNSKKWTEIEDANYTNAPYGNYNVIRLDDVFSNISDYSKYTFTFDIKLYTENPDYADFIHVFTDEIVKFYNKYGLYNNVYVESQDPEFLNLLKSKKPEIGGYYYPQTFEDGFNRAMQFGFRGISISTDAISKEQVQQAHDNGLFVTIWGVETKKRNEEAILKNPDMIQTDKVDYLVKLLH